MLKWEPTHSDEAHRDQNATSRLVEHGYWALGDNHTSWTLELRETNASGDEIAQPYSLTFPTEDEAKAFAAAEEAAA